MLRIAFGLFCGFVGFSVGLMMQVGPHDAATNFCNWLSVWQACAESLPSSFDKWAWTLPASLVGAAAILLLWAPAAAIIKTWTSRRGLIPLSEAASHIYGELRGTDLGRFTEGHTGAPDEILDNVGMQILHNARVWVRRAPAPNWELFPKSELSKMGICNGATGIRYWGQEQVFYSDPKLSRRDLRRVAKHLKKNANLISEWSKAAPKQPDIKQTLAIEIGDYEPFFTTTGNSSHTKRTFNVKISNNHNLKAAAFCKLHILKIDPQTEYEGPWTFPEIRSLPAGDHTFIPLAVYGEARDPRPSIGDSFFAVLVGKRQPLLPIDRQYELLLRATAHGMSPSELRCKLWVDEQGRFRIEKVCR